MNKILPALASIPLILLAVVGTSLVAEEPASVVEQPKKAKYRWAHRFLKWVR